MESKRNPSVRPLTTDITATTNDTVAAVQSAVQEAVATAPQVTLWGEQMKQKAAGLLELTRELMEAEQAASTNNSKSPTHQ
jgi:hypothetical protein